MPNEPKTMADKYWSAYFRNRERYLMPDDHKTTGLAPTELVQIEGDDIVIRVSLAALIFASEHGCLCTFSQLKSDFVKVKIIDPVQWRGAIVRALRREQENGDTPVHLMLDDALKYAVDQGEEGIEIEGAL